jgi:hypothetical protein
MQPSYDAPEAPTHLRAGDLPPGLLDDAVRPDSYHSESALPTRARAEPAPLPAAPHYHVEPHSIMSVSWSSVSRRAHGAPRIVTEPGSVITPAIVPPARRLQRTPQARTAAPAPQPTQRSTPQLDYPPASQAAAPQAAAVPSLVPGAPPGIDPLAIPTPPELAGPIYGYIRRLALQADLSGADRVLRDALAELTSSLSCSIVYPAQDGLWTLGADDEIPRDPQPLIAVATARRAVIATHMALIPVVTTSEAVAVITLTRNARQPAYQVIEQIAMIALAREAAPILHHLAVQHLQRAREIQADKGEIEVLAFLPGKDGPRIRNKMGLQLELDGYTKARAIGSITHVQADAVSGTEAAKLGGDMLVESIAKELQAGTWIAVRARLPSKTFKTEHNTYHYHHGMHAKAEVKIQSKPFLDTLLPALEKYLPD